MSFFGEGEYTDPFSGEARDPHGVSNPQNEDRNVVGQQPLLRAADFNKLPEPREADFSEAPMLNALTTLGNLAGAPLGIQFEPQIDTLGNTSTQVMFSPLAALASSTGVGAGVSALAGDYFDNPGAFELGRLGGIGTGAELDIGADPNYQDNSSDYALHSLGYLGPQEGTTFLGMPVVYNAPGVSGPQSNRDVHMAQLRETLHTPPTSHTPQQMNPSHTPLTEYLEAMRRGEFPWIQ